MRDLLLAILAGALQGLAEWLPISSEGLLSAVFALGGASADRAIQLSLFLHLGTTLAAAAYFEADLRRSIATLPEWRPQRAFEESTAEPSFLAVATATTGLVGVPAYVLAVDAASRLTGGALVAAIGGLLLVTGTLQLTSDAVGLSERESPSLRDAVLVGAAQGLAILPGVSRSGVTTSALLFEGYDASAAFRLSFLLSIPAGIGAAALVLVDAGGVPSIGLVAGTLALAASVVVGYLAIGALLAVVERVPFWAVCYGLGGLAIVGGGFAATVA